MDIILTCSYCHKDKHTRDKCFYLHGYPPWHKLYGQPKLKLKTSSKGTTITQVYYHANSGMHNQSYTALPTQLMNKSQSPSVLSTASHPLHYTTESGPIVSEGTAVVGSRASLNTFTNAQ